MSDCVCVCVYSVEYIGLRGTSVQVSGQRAY